MKLLIALLSRRIHSRQDLARVIVRLTLMSGMSYMDASQGVRCLKEIHEDMVEDFVQKHGEKYLLPVESKILVDTHHREYILNLLGA